MITSSQSFGVSPDGQDAALWIIENSSGLRLTLTDWGATIVTVTQPDRNGRPADVALSLPDASAYRSSAGYIGATCGRFANRIAEGRFRLNGQEYVLARNNGPNHLHGGDRGFNERMWNGEPYAEGDRNGVVFRYLSPDGEEGYPGEAKVRADYALDEAGRLFMDFRAETDAPTIVNLTNHAYWNPTGVAGGTIHNVELKLFASRYLPVDDTAIPLGNLAGVQGTPFDFRTAKPIGGELDEVPGGYDHCMVIDGDAGNLRIAAEARDPESGRRFSLFTDRPGVQFYTGNNLTGEPFPKHGGFCLEPEDFPDAPNRSAFPAVVLKPGEVYHHRSIMEFSTD